MSLDLYLVAAKGSPCTCNCGHQHPAKRSGTELWTTNITHNLALMFEAAGVYEILWRGTGLRAGAQVEKLQAALRLMTDDPERFKAFDAPNGWGTYDHAIDFITRVIRACEQFPDAEMECSR